MPRQKYPWDEWLNGETWELRRGKDFQVSCEGVRAAAFQAGKQRGKRAKTRIIRDEDGEGLAIRAYEEGEEFPWETARAGPGKYPWDEWLNGETWELRRGRDFQLRTLAFISIARMTSKRAGKKLKTRIVRDEDGEGVAMRAYEEGDEFPWEDARGKYPWDEWLNGEAWELRRGRDFQASCKDFRATVLNTAARRDKRVKTRIIRDEDGEGLAIRAYED